VCNAAQCFPVARAIEGDMGNDGSGGIRQQQRNQAEENKAERVEAAQGGRGREAKFLEATMDAFNHVCLVALVSRYCITGYRLEAHCINH
jgi:hypothetical protein